MTTSPLANGMGGDGPGAGRAPRVAFATLGCKVNRADTARIEDGLPPGVEVVSFAEAADLYVINTCTVTGMADRESRQLIHRAHRRNPAARILVTGCLAELRPEEVAGREGVLEVLPNAEKEGLARRIAALLGLAPAAPDRAPEGAAERRYVYRPREVTRPPLKIQDGCGGACTYCTVAAARGTPTSVPAAEVEEALACYGRQGCAEVVLAGIDLGSYGLDLAPPGSLAALLRWHAAERPVPRLRLSSLEVHRLGDDLVAALSEAGDAVCRHLHLPLQSGAEPVLARMRRPYDAATYRARFLAAREALPGAALGADVIAGFPGETDADHRATLALLEELAPAYLHVFPYSPRPGTPAASFPDAVPQAVARARAAELRALSERLVRRYRESRIGQATSAVIYFVRRQGRLTGFTGEGLAVELEGSDGLMGKVVPIRIEGLTESGVCGRALLE